MRNICKKMELFYSEEIDNKNIVLTGQEFRHCVRVKRHRVGDIIYVVDGKGNLYSARMLSVSGDSAALSVEETTPNYGGHPYYLNLCVAPVKNPDRFEWFLEKATEIGIDEITPLLCSNSERRVLFKPQRANNIVISAAKQSLKARFPVIRELVDVKQFIESLDDDKGIKLIAHCNEAMKERISINDALKGDNSATILIGPEGDFTEEEIRYAENRGFISVHLGKSRLRTETAALMAVAAMYYNK